MKELDERDGRSSRAAAAPPGRRPQGEGSEGGEEDNDGDDEEEDDDDDASRDESTTVVESEASRHEDGASGGPSFADDAVAGGGATDKTATTRDSSLHIGLGMARGGGGTGAPPAPRHARHQLLRAILIAMKVSISSDAFRSPASTAPLTTHPLGTYARPSARRRQQPALARVLRAVAGIFTESTTYSKSSHAMRHQECFALKPNTDGMMDVLRKAFLANVDDIYRLADEYAATYDIAVQVRETASRGYYLSVSADLGGDLPQIFIQPVKNGRFIHCTTEEVRPCRSR